MDCPGLSPQRRFHPRSVLSCYFNTQRMTALRFVKALVDSPGGGRKRGRWYLTAARRMCRISEEGDLSVARSREHPSPAKSVPERRRHAAAFIA